MVVVFELLSASESSGRLVKTQIVGPWPQSFWFSNSEMDPQIWICNRAPPGILTPLVQGPYFENYCPVDSLIFGWKLVYCWKSTRLGDSIPEFLLLATLTVNLCARHLLSLGLILLISEKETFHHLFNSISPFLFLWALCIDRLFFP